MNASPPDRSAAPWYVRGWFWVVPIAAVLELGAHVHQTRSVIRPEAWREARAYVESVVAPSDLIVVAPRWAEPIARQELGNQLLTLPRLGRADATSFPRVIQIAQRGAADPEVERWPVKETRRFGGLTVTIRENPTPVTVADTVLPHVGRPEMRVAVVDRSGTERPCAFVQASPQTGTFTGATIPAERYECSGSVVGTTILPDLAYDPRHCVLVLPPPDGRTVRIDIDGFRWSGRLYGHHGLYAVGERPLHGAPTTVSFQSGERSLGRFVHQDGDGWKRFEALTPDLAGQTAPLRVEISGGGGPLRQYCFVADTR